MIENIFWKFFDRESYHSIMKREDNISVYISNIKLFAGIKNKPIQRSSRISLLKFRIQTELLEIVGTMGFLMNN